MKVVINRQNENISDRNIRDVSLKYNDLSEKLNCWYKGLYDNKLISSIYFEKKLMEEENLEVKNPAWKRSKDIVVKTGSAEVFWSKLLNCLLCRSHVNKNKHTIDKVAEEVADRLKEANAVKNIHKTSIDNNFHKKTPPSSANKIHFTNGGTLVHLIDFCLLTARFKTARVLVSQQSRMFGGGISTGVHAIMTCRQLTRNIIDHPGLLKSLEINSIVFEKYVCDLIQESTHTDRESTSLLMLKPNEYFNNNSVFEMVNQEQCLELVKLPIWQNILDSAWCGPAPKYKIELLPLYLKSPHGAIFNLMNKLIGHLLMFLLSCIDHIMAIFIVVCISASNLGGRTVAGDWGIVLVVTVCFFIINFIWLFIPALRADRIGMTQEELNDRPWRKHLRWIFGKRFNYKFKTHITKGEKELNTYSKFLEKCGWKKLAHYYDYKLRIWKTPAVLFVQNIMGHIFLAILLADIMWFRLCFSISATEWYTLGLIVCLFIEEIREFLKSGTSWRDRFSTHLSSVWNYIDLGGFIFFMAAFWIKYQVINRGLISSEDADSSYEKHWSHDCGNHSMVSFDGDQTYSNVSFIHVQ